MLLRLCVAALLVLAAGCSADVLNCTLDRECVNQQGGFGLCLDSHCAFKDVACTGGYRWDDSAGAQAGMCASLDTVNGHTDAGVKDGPLAVDAGASDAPLQKAD